MRTQSRPRNSDWLSLEQLAARIYSELEPTARVQHNDAILGVISGANRQIDVSIRSSFAGHEILTIVETKDLGRRATVEHIDEFASKIRDVRANVGVLICRSGFTRGAAEYARRRGIDLCRVHDAASRKWKLDVRLPVLWRCIQPGVQMEIRTSFPEPVVMPSDVTDWVVDFEDGTEPRTLNELFIAEWNVGRFPRIPGVELTAQSMENMRVLAHTLDGRSIWRPVARLLMRIDITEHVYLGHITLDQCRGLMHADGRFIASYIPRDLLRIARDPTWPEVDPSDIAIQIGTTVITTDVFRVRSSRSSTIATQAIGANPST